MAGSSAIRKRFRGFLPVVVDLETGGFESASDAILEIAAVIIEMDLHGKLKLGQTISAVVEPFVGANIEPKSLEITGIDLNNPLRQKLALGEEAALKKIFAPIRAQLKIHACSRAILTGHNAFFDLGFLNAAILRNKIKRNPFHKFSNFDTVSLAGMAYGQTVLARACEAANITWNNQQAHSAVYDAQQTAKLFCKIINDWDDAHPQRRLTLFCD